MSTRKAEMNSDLKPKDRVRWIDYGEGVVLSVGPGHLVIDWEREGTLYHLPSFAKNLERL